MKMPILRDEHEIQRAHDILEAVVRGEVNILPVSPDTELAMRTALATLCWVLGHDQGSTSFAANLAVVERAIAAAGYVLKERTQ